MAKTVQQFRISGTRESQADRLSEPAGRGVVRRLFEPVGVDFLVYFRIAFGAIMLWEVWRYLEAGWVRRNFIDPPVHFSFYGFEWVKPWPGDGMYVHFYVMGVLAAMIALGLFYRVAAALFFFAFAYVFLLEKAFYLNHFYLICLISFLMVALPANRAFSLDAKLWPSIRASTVPAWTLWLLRAQIGIVYFYGGLAKLNTDWLTGNPMREMLAAADTFPILGRFFHLEPVIVFYAWAGLVLDLLIVPALTWKPTRLPALIAAALFHLSNDMLFQIGIFPWFMLTATLLLWPPRKLEPLWLMRTVLATVYIYGSLAVLNTELGDVAAIRHAGLAVSLLCLPLMAWKRARLPAFVLATGWLLFSVSYWGPGGMPGTLQSLLPGLVLWSAIVVFPPESLRNFRIVQQHDVALLEGRDRRRPFQGRFSPRRSSSGTPSSDEQGVLNEECTAGRSSLIAASDSSSLSASLTLGFLGLFLLVQLLVPFRHWLYPGNVNWTEEGHLFAWHMKLRYKRGRAAFRAYRADGKPIPELAAGGFLIFEHDDDGRRTHVLDARGNRKFELTRLEGRTVALDDAGTPVYELNEEGWFVYELDKNGRRIYALDAYGERIYETDENGRPILERDRQGNIIPERKPPYYLMRRQMEKMSERPDMILQYAHFLAGALERLGYRDVAIRADAFCSLNGRREQRLVDPNVNLARVDRSLGHATWIVPLDPTLKPGVMYEQRTPENLE